MQEARNYYDPVKGMVNNPTVLFDLAIKVGWVYKIAGSYKDAIPYFLEAAGQAELSNHIPNSQLALNASHLADCYIQLGSFEKALEYTRKSHGLYEDTQPGGLRTDSDFIDCFLGLGMLDSAAHYGLRAVNYYREVGAIAFLATTYMKLGEVEERQQNQVRAKGFYLQALVYSEWITENKAVFDKNQQGQVAWFSSLQDVAQSFEEQGLLLQYQVNEKLARVSEQLGDTRDWVTHLEKMITLKNKIDLLDKQQEVLSLNTRFETERKEQTILLLEKGNELARSDIRQSRLMLFLISGFLLTVLLFVLLYLRQNRMRAEQEQVNLKQRLFRSQMNPHFLYNSLASIQKFIITEDPDNASVYLSKFSNLVRNILDSSIEEYVTLEKELDTIENYLALQRVRFSEKLDYKVEVDESLDVENMEVPPMLMQPFIENAVEHGIRYKKEKGNILVRMFKGDGAIVIEVEDDGVGRERAGEIQRDQNRDHKSLATSITSDRIRILNKKFNQIITMQIIDLKDDLGSPSGTRVIFNISLS
jgi:tetratricopeptide (TPR) repeat protein